MADLHRVMTDRLAWLDDELARIAALRREPLYQCPEPKMNKAKDDRIRHDQVPWNATKHEMAALAERFTQFRKVASGKRTMAPQSIDKYGKLR